MMLSFLSQHGCPGFSQPASGTAWNSIYFNESTLEGTNIDGIYTVILFIYIYISRRMSFLVGSQYHFSAHQLNSQERRNITVHPQNDEGHTRNDDHFSMSSFVLLDELDAIFIV